MNIQYSKSKVSKTAGKHKKNKKFTRETKFDRFLVEFANEIDVFDSEKSFPEWIIQYREQQIGKVSKFQREICEYLRESGVKFKFKYPIEIDGKYKFADFYIPKKRTVILLLSSFIEFNRMCSKDAERTEFFKDRFKVVELYEYDKEAFKEKLNF